MEHDPLYGVPFSMTKENRMRVPNHIAIILDGNGRWAKKRGMPRSYGHVKGCENLEDICDAYWIQF